MSQRRRTAPARRPKRALGTTNRTHLAFTILGALVVFSLVASIAGPPLVDYLTKPNDDSGTTVDSGDTSDPNESQYRAEIAAKPNNPEPLAALGTYLGNTGRVDEAIPLFEQALTLAPDDYGTRLVFADVLAKGDKRADAEVQYRKVIAAQPENAQAHYGLARLYETWVPAKTDQAIAEYQRVVAVGDGTYVKDLAVQALQSLGAASPVAGSPVAVNPTEEAP